MEPIKVSSTDVKLKSVFRHPKGYPLEGDLFLQAVRAGKFRLVTQILKVNTEVNVNQRDAQHLTPLLIAVQHQNYEKRNNLVKILLEHGADVNSTDQQGLSPLMHACQSSDRVDTIRTLIKQPACSVNLKDAAGRTALNWAASVDNWRAVRVIVNSKFTRNTVDICNKDNRGLSPLETAIENGYTETCRVLLQEGKVDTLKLSSHYKAKLENLSKSFPEMFSESDTINSNEIIDIESPRLHTKLHPVSQAVPVLTPIEGELSYPHKFPKLPAISNDNGTTH